jgi:hypothetical protein
VIAAFLNDDDMKETNTLDMYVEKEGRHFIEHNLIDFGNSLGSSTTGPKNLREGHQYGFDAGNLLKTLATFGIDRPPKREAGPVAFSSVGNFEDETFRPERWKPNVPNAAFENMTDRDGYWGAKIVSSFTDQQIAAAVRAGKYSDRAAERQVIKILRDRRQRVSNYWFRRVAPVDHFRIQGNALVFEDLAIQTKLDSAVHVRYAIAISSAKQAPASLDLKPGTRIPLQIPSEGPVKAQITRTSPGSPSLSATVYVARVHGVPTIVRIDR